LIYLQKKALSSAQLELFYGAKLKYFNLFAHFPSF